MTEPLKVLFVCTGNICRSPSAELLARQRYGDHEVKFRSAGFIPDGQRCPQKLVDVLAQRGIDGGQHRSYQIDQASLEAADIILTMEAAHVQKATIIGREAFPRMFPLKEVAELLESGMFQGLEDFLHDANQGRDPFRYMETRWDVDDPYGKSTQEYRAAVEEISDLVDSVVSPLVELSHV